MPRQIATLSMYDWPETATALDRLWTLVHHELAQRDVSSPQVLTRSKDVYDLWADPQLLAAQTCGWPYANRLRGQVIPFARFAYDLPECKNGYYNSVYIGGSKADAAFLENKNSLLRADRIAINGEDSQSGFHVFREITGEASPGAIPKHKRLITGSHRHSVRAVAEGRAQIAAIDGVAFALACRHDPEVAARVSVIGHSNPVPGLPLVTAINNKQQATILYDSFVAGVAKLDDAGWKTLLLKGVVPAHDEEYDGFL